MAPEKRDAEGDQTLGAQEASRLHHHDQGSGLPRIDAYAVDPAALSAFDTAAQHRATAAKAITAAVTWVAAAAALAGADRDDVVQAVNAVRRELMHALAAATAVELADGEWL